MRDITEEEIQNIYQEKFWKPCHCESLHPPLDLVVFDSAVQHGTGRAGKWLQRVVGTVPDGLIGDMTLTAVKREVLKQNLAELVEQYLLLRTAFYAAIIAHDPVQGKFEHGWKNRIAALRKEIV